jgi:ribosome-associated protein
MIVVTPDISIPAREVRFDFVRASGPGGQNVNKVATAVQLRFDVNRSAALPADVKTRLRTLAGKKLSTDGILVIQASRFKGQDQNRQDALDRLVRLIRQAAVKPRKRIRTKPSRNSKLRRLASKRLRGRLKRNRRRVNESRD